MAFGPAGHVYDRVHLSDEGGYLLVAPHLGEGDPVVAVGWARNDHWAVQCWATNGKAYRNDHDPQATGTEPPSLEPLGWSHPLAYEQTLSVAKARSRQPVVVSAGHRFASGAFQSHVIAAAPGVRFHYDDPNPGPADVAVAVELGLGGRRWKQHLAQSRAENRGA